MVKNVYNGEKVHWMHENSLKSFILSGMNTIADVQIQRHEVVNFCGTNFVKKLQTLLFYFSTC